MVFGKGPLVEDNDNRRKCCFCPGCADFFSIKNRYCLMEEDQVRNKENRNSHMRQWKVFSGVQRKNERRRKIKGDIFNIFA